MTEPQLYEQLKHMAIDLGDGSRDPYYGWGVVDIKTPAALPGAAAPDPEPEKEEKSVTGLQLTSPYTRGDEVKKLQTLLTAHGFPCGEVDAIFGPATDKALRAFQKVRGLTENGTADEATWAALSAAPEAGASLLEMFITYLWEQLSNSSIYVWGAQGQTGSQITEAWMRNRETSTDNASRAIAFWKKQLAAGYKNLRAFDCSGLGMYFTQNLHGISTSDKSANGMMGLCSALERKALRKGDWILRATPTTSAMSWIIISDRHRGDGARQRRSVAACGR